MIACLTTDHKTLIARILAIPERHVMAVLNGYLNEGK